MFNSQTYNLSNVTKTWSVLVAVLFMSFFWQYTNSSAHAAEDVVTQPVQVAAAEPAAPVISPEQRREQQLEMDYKRASFLTVVETNDKIRFSKTDLFCMAKNIYHEAGHEPTLGKYAVAQVTINRMESPLFGDKVCEVVFEPKQFSWANNHSRRWTHPSGEAWDEAMRIARDVLENGKRIKGMDDALFYHATYVRPSWARTKDRLTRIGLHIFYEQV